jgi:hypothetical protein
MSDLEVSAQVRATAVQTAGNILGDHAFLLGGPGYGYHAKPSAALIDLTERVEEYIKHGEWDK